MFNKQIQMDSMEHIIWWKQRPFKIMMGEKMGGSVLNFNVLNFVISFLATNRIKLCLEGLLKHSNKGVDILLPLFSQGL